MPHVTWQANRKPAHRAPPLRHIRTAFSFCREQNDRKLAERPLQGGERTEAEARRQGLLCRSGQGRR